MDTALLNELASFYSRLTDGDCGAYSRQTATQPRINAKLVNRIRKSRRMPIANAQNVNDCITWRDERRATLMSASQYNSGARQVIEFLGLCLIYVKSFRLAGDWK